MDAFRGFSALAAEMPRLYPQVDDDVGQQTMLKSTTANPRLPTATATAAASAAAANTNGQAPKDRTSLRALQAPLPPSAAYPSRKRPCDMDIAPPLHPTMTFAAKANSFESLSASDIAMLDDATLLELEIERRRRSLRSSLAALEEASRRNSAISKLEKIIAASVGGGGGTPSHGHADRHDQLRRLSSTSTSGSLYGTSSSWGSNSAAYPYQQHSFLLQDSLPSANFPRQASFAAASSAELLNHAEARASAQARDVDVEARRMVQRWHNNFGRPAQPIQEAFTPSPQQQLQLLKTDRQMGEQAMARMRRESLRCNVLNVDDARMMAFQEHSKVNRPSDCSVVSAWSTPKENEEASINVAAKVAESVPDTTSAPEVTGTLFLPSDVTFLSEAQSYLRSLCIEFFTASPSHVNAHGKGARPSREGQVGLRCVHCRDVPRCQQANQSISFPSKRDNIFESVKNFQRVHFNTCQYIPDVVKNQYKEIIKRGRGPRRSQTLVRAYYAQAASEVGMVDTEKHGLEYREDRCRIRRDPSEEMKSILRAAMVEDEMLAKGSRPSAYSKSKRSMARSKMAAVKEDGVKYGKFDGIASEEALQVLDKAKHETTPFVMPEDFTDVSDFVYLLFHQLLPCKHTPSTIKRRKLNPDQISSLPGGLCCKHCSMIDGINGMYFPLNVDSLGDSSFSQTLMMHISSCPHVPPEVKSALEEFKALAKEHKSCVKRGAKKIFMEKVWDRMEEISKREKEEG